MEFKTIVTAKDWKRKPASKVYPESRVVLDPTCTLQQILNRAQYGMQIPQRDVSGDITQEEIQVLGLNGTSFATMTRMEMIDLRMRAQMRLQALEASRLKKQQAAIEEARKRGNIVNVEQQVNTEQPTE